MDLKTLDYVVLIVDDVTAVLEFYTGALGLTLKHRSGDYAQIDTGTARLGLYQREAMSRILGRELPSRGDSVSFELGFKVPDCDLSYTTLLAKGVQGAVAPENRPWGQRTAYVYDPEGNLVELAQDLSTPR